MFMDTELKKSSDAKDKIQQAKRKAQRPVVGNMDPLLDALTSIVGGDELEKTPGYTKTQKSKSVPDMHSDISLWREIFFFLI